jgi:ACS family tartrate transporter-like MFS transporter
MSTDTSLVSALQKVMWRLLPFLMLLLLFNLLDRTNISFAALQMNTQFGFTPSVYGLAAGIFFIGYFLFEVPSNLVLVRVGARPWLARIMISWGVVVIAMAWVRGAGSFYTLRFLLGVAEAGLLPGVLLYLTRWVPRQRLALAFSILMATTALANVLSGPIATSLMQLDGLAGLRGWQLLFVAEGISTVLIGTAVALYLPERPADARWLSAEERAALASTIAAEDSAKCEHGATSFRQGFLDRRVLIATLVMFLFVCCNFGTVFWLPQILRSTSSATTMQIGFLASVPYLLGGLATIFWGRHSDRSAERKRHLIAGALVGAVGYAYAATAGSATGSFLGLCVATTGIWSMFGVFWAYVGDLLGGAAAAGGFALINSASALAGFVAPVLMGLMREHTHSFTGALLLLAALALLAALTSLLINDSVRPRSATAALPGSLR